MGNEKGGGSGDVLISCVGAKMGGEGDGREGIEVED